MNKGQNIHAGHRIRLRERVQKEGLENFNEHQVLEYVLAFVVPRKDTNVIAHNLINIFGSLHAVLNASCEDLQQVNNIGERVSMFICTLKDVFAYYQKNELKEITKIFNTSDAVKYLSPILSHKREEEFYLLCIDSKNNLIRHEKIAWGDVNQINVSIRAISSMISRYKVANIVIAHNHPKASFLPSVNDNVFTKALYINCRLNGVNLLDHIIINKEGYYSYNLESVLDGYKLETEKLLTIQE